LNVASVFIRLLNTRSIFVGDRIGGIYLNESVMVKSRCELEEKMAVVFNEEIKELSTELREILIDDLVTAFENRVNVLNRIQVGRRFR
jgi:hypothetical protein